MIVLIANDEDNDKRDLIDERDNDERCQFALCSGCCLLVKNSSAMSGMLSW